MVHKSYQLQLALPLCQFLFIYFQRAAMINKADNYHFREKDFYITFAIFRSSCFPCAMPLCSISCSLHFHLFPFYPCRRSSHQKQINFFYHFIAWVGLFRLRPDFRIQISQKVNLKMALWCLVKSVMVNICTLLCSVTEHSSFFSLSLFFFFLPPMFSADHDIFIAVVDRMHMMGR